MKFSKSLSILSILLVLISTISSEDIEIIMYDTIINDDILTKTESPTIPDYELKLGHDLFSKSVKKLKILSFALYLDMINSYDFIGSPDNILKFTKFQCIVLITSLARNYSLLRSYDDLVEIARKYSLEIRKKFSKDYEVEISNLLD